MKNPHTDLTKGKTMEPLKKAQDHQVCVNFGYKENMLTYRYSNKMWENHSKSNHFNTGYNKNVINIQNI